MKKDIPAKWKLKKSRGSYTCIRKADFKSKAYKKRQFLQFSSVSQSCPTLCDHMDYSTPGLPVYYQLPESTQTHVHCVDDAI